MSGRRRRPPSFCPRLWRRRGAAGRGAGAAGGNGCGRSGLRRRRGAALDWSGNRSWNPLWTWKTIAEIVPELDAALDQEAALPDSPGELDEAFASGGERPVMREMGRRRTARALRRQRPSAGTGQKPEAARSAPAGAGSGAAGGPGAGPGSGPPEPHPGVGSDPPLTGTGLFSLPDGGGERRRTKHRRDGLAGREDQARLIDRAFQRDSRRYDRGFSLY